MQRPYHSNKPLQNTFETNRWFAHFPDQINMTRKIKWHANNTYVSYHNGPEAILAWLMMFGVAASMKFEYLLCLVRTKNTTTKHLSIACHTSPSPCLGNMSKRLERRDLDILFMIGLINSPVWSFQHIETCFEIFTHLDAAGGQFWCISLQHCFDIFRIVGHTLMLFLRLRMFDVFSDFRFLEPKREV